MIKVVEWIKSHKALTFAFLLLLFFIPIIIVQILFQFDTGVTLFQAKWSAGDALNYVIGYATIVSTTFLSLVALYQSERAEKNTQFLNQIMAQKLYPVVGANKFKCKDTKQCNGRPLFFPDKMRFSCARTYNESAPETEYIDLIVNVDIDKNNLTPCYLKELDFDLFNNSEAVIRHLGFSAFRICGYEDEFPPVSIINTVSGNGISRLLNQNGYIHIRAKFYFHNPQINELWADNRGGMAFILFVVNTTITGQQFNEYISIRANSNGHTDVSYGDKTLKEVENNG